MVEEPSTTRLNRLVDATQEAAPWVCLAIVPPKPDSSKTNFKFVFFKPSSQLFLDLLQRRGVIDGGEVAGVTFFAYRLNSAAQQLTATGFG